MNLYSLFVYIEHNGDESPKIHVHLPGVSEVDLKEVGCEDGRCVDVAQDCVQRRAL